MGPKPAQSQQTSGAQRADRRMSPPSDAGSPPQMGETAEMRERRRKQNRLAQQAFRARQKVRVEALETEWAQLRTLHEALNNACSERDKEIQQLHSRVEELVRDIELLKNSSELEKGWQSSPSPSASSSYASSAYDQQFAQTDQRAMPQFNLANYFGKNGFSTFPDFPLGPGWFQGNQR